MESQHSLQNFFGSDRHAIGICFEIFAHGRARAGIEEKTTKNTAKIGSDHPIALRSFLNRGVSRVYQGFSKGLSRVFADQQPPSFLVGQVWGG